MREGDLELMVHRYTSHDDNRGVGEGLHDSKPIRMKHYLLLLDNNSDKNAGRIV